MEHWILLTFDRECGYPKVEGIFNSSGEAWQCYYNTYNDDAQYWRRPKVERWENNLETTPKEEWD